MGAMIRALWRNVYCPRLWGRTPLHGSRSSVWCRAYVELWKCGLHLQVDGQQRHVVQPDWAACQLPVTLRLSAGPTGSSIIGLCDASGRLALEGELENLEKKEL